MSHLNHATVEGLLKEAPVVRRTESGFPIVTLRLQNTRNFTLKDGKRQSRSCYITVKAKGGAMEQLLSPVGPGARIIADGRLDVESWQDYNGETRTQMVLDAASILLVAGPLAPAVQPQAAPQPPPAMAPELTAAPVAPASLPPPSRPATATATTALPQQVADEDLPF